MGAVNPGIQMPGGVFLRLNADVSTTLGTPQNTNLAWDVGVNEVWNFQVILITSSYTTDVDIIGLFSGPASATIAAISQEDSATGTWNQITVFGDNPFGRAGIGAGDVGAEVTGSITTAGTPGTIRLLFYKDSGADPAVIYAGSTLWAVRATSV